MSHFCSLVRFPMRLVPICKNQKKKNDQLKTDSVTSQCFFLPAKNNFACQVTVSYPSCTHACGASVAHGRFVASLVSPASCFFFFASTRGGCIGLSKVDCWRAGLNPVHFPFGSEKKLNEKGRLADPWRCSTCWGTFARLQRFAAGDLAVAGPACTWVACLAWAYWRDGSWQPQLHRYQMKRASLSWARW